MTDKTDAFAAKLSEIMKGVELRREAILEAWLAETGLLPSESVLVHQLTAEGVYREWVERRKPDDR